MSEAYIDAVKSHDRSVIERAGKAPPGIAKDLDEINASLDAESRELAIELVVRQDNQYAGAYLLRRTGDDDVNIATLAVEKLGKVVNKPSAADTIGAIPLRNDSFIRGELYLFVGRSSESGALEGLRQLEPKEKDDEAKLRLLAARVKLGGKPERQEFVGFVAKTEPDDVMQMQDLMTYIGDAAVAKGVISWLDREDGIVRIGSDRQNGMARMNDVAVWITHLLKITLPFETTSLRNFNADEIASTRKILELLPD